MNDCKHKHAITLPPDRNDPLGEHKYCFDCQSAIYPDGTVIRAPRWFGIGLAELVAGHNSAKARAGLV